MVSPHKQKINYTYVWQPQVGPQQWLVDCPVFEVLFGGARGGGKSDGVLGEFAIHADMYGPNAIGLCVRRERTQLVELIERSRIIYTPIGARFNEQDKLWRFPNGARLRFAYLESDNDAQSYQGHSYTRVYVEEMGTFANPDPIFKLMATLRSGAGVPCRFIATANPGGPGHLWIKQRYIDPAPLGLKILPTQFKNPFTSEVINKDRVFIPSRVTDNKYTNTSEYIGNLYLSGNDELVRAWLLGDWNVMLGAFFQEWNIRKHVIKEFKIPKSWTRFMSMDWGSYRPFSIGWWTVVPDEFDFGYDTNPLDWHSNAPIKLPRGAIVRYREYYGCQRDKIGNIVPNMGLKMSVEDVAREIVRRERFEPRNYNNRPNILYRVVDPKMHSRDGGPSMSERMASKPYYLILRKADNKRVPQHGAMGGWDQVRARLRGNEDGRPMMYFMDNCTEAIRTLPAMQHDIDKPEDVDTTGEDHAPDEIRYACMSRPMVRGNMFGNVRNALSSRDNSFANSQIVMQDNLDWIDTPQDNFNRDRIQ